MFAFYRIGNEICFIREGQEDLLAKMWVEARPLPGMEEVKDAERLTFLFSRKPGSCRDSFLVNDLKLLLQKEESAAWLSSAELEKAAEQDGGVPDPAETELLAGFMERGGLRAVNTAREDWKEILAEASSAAGPSFLPAGKKPIVMSQDDVCYYEYMTDSDGDGKPDKGGDGFASRLLVRDGKLTCEYVDADGQTRYGSYDLVPLLDDFLEQHPDFSYRGARAIIAVTGYQGAFGYRISSDYKAKLGDEAFAQACRDAREVADALRAEGYTIASHSYGHLTYGDISPERLAGDAQKWNDQIAAVIGETDVLLYPFGSDIAGVEAYKGAKFDTLYGLGFRYFCNVDSAKHWVQIHDGYVRQGRRNIDGYRMYYQPNLLDDLFDTKTVWDDARPTPVPKI